jgi:nitrate/nitrite-specific signal transduction histidine kinase
VADDGCGFDPLALQPGHYGLVGLQEQAQAIGAQLQIDSGRGQGSRVQIVWLSAPRPSDPA